jgi:hypothetical protein
MAPDGSHRLDHELMSRPPEAPPAKVAVDSPKCVVELLDEFLDWASRNKARRTYEWYRENIQRFAAAIPAGLTMHIKIADGKHFYRFEYTLSSKE